MNIRELLKISYDMLKSENIDTYMLDSKLLLGRVLKKDKIFIMTSGDCEVSKEHEDSFLDLVNLRKKRMPMQYILGEAEFMGLPFKVREGVLIPRPDTEVLVEEVLSNIMNKGYKSFCDVCCGSGAIGLSIARHLSDKNIDIKVTMTDISDDAISVSQENAENLSINNVEILQGDLLEKVIEAKEKFDVIVSNPPYIKTDVIPGLMSDVKDYEPYIALWGGDDGLDFYRRITEESLKVLKKDGMLAFEIGHDEEKEVKDLLINNGFRNVYSLKDLGGNYRVVIGFL